MRQKRAVGTPVGRVEFETVMCDGCGTESVVKETVGWLEIRNLPESVAAQTLDDSIPLGDTIWCSRPCLINALVNPVTVFDAEPLGANDPELQ